MSTETDTSQPPAPARRVRRTTKGRRARLRRRRRRAATGRAAAFVVASVAIAAAIVGVVELVAGGDTPASGPAGPVASEPGGDPQPTLVLATFDEAEPDAGASLIVVLAHEPGGGTGTVLLVPGSTVADAPGHGLLPLGRAFAFGRGPLLDTSLDNLLGVDLDHVVSVSEQGWSSLFARVGGLTLDVPERLVERRDDGSSQVRFQPGEQFLDGPRLAELLVFQQPDETELARLPRAQLVLMAFLEQLHRDGEAVEAVFADGAPMLDTTAPPELVRDVFTGLAAAAAEGSLVVRTLPVDPIGSGEQDTYRVDTERMQQLVDERFAQSVPVGRADSGRLLQVLNGHGAPGIGQQVAQRLLPEGFRVVLTGNADRFDHQTTRIVVYEDTAEQLAIAEQVRRILGVGEITVSQTPQSVVDITIVVGRDFPPG